MARLSDHAREPEALLEAQDAGGQKKYNFLDLVRGLASNPKDIGQEARLKYLAGRDAKLNEEADVAIKAMDTAIALATGNLNIFIGASVSA